MIINENINSTYAVSIISKSTGITYNVTKILLDLTLAENDGQISQCATVSFINLLYENTYLSSLINVMDRIFIYADDGEKKDEVFRGFVWERNYRSGLEKEITLVCYDNLIYFQQSEDTDYFTAGQDTDDICGALCSKWGVELSYSYETISHPKLPVSGKLADIFTSDILDEVKKKKGKKYVMLSAKDIVKIATVGQNAVKYHVRAKENSGTIEDDITMDNVVTQVIITGKADDEERTPIEDTLKGNVEWYRTIQQTVSSNEDKPEEARSEAEEILEAGKEPERVIHINGAVNKPWIRKGDAIILNAGNIVETECIVKSITHDGYKKTMDIDVTISDGNQDSTGGGTGANGDYSAGKKLSLSNVPLYISSDASSQALTVSGTYYLYDGIEILGRFRITNTSERVGAKPINSNVTGWIDKEYV